MNQILVDGGFAPEWIMLKKDIDKMKEDLKIEMNKQCLKSIKTIPTHVNLDHEQLKQKWFNYCDDKFLENEVSLLNKTIDKYNLMVPMIQSQKFHFNLSKEAEKVWKTHDKHLNPKTNLSQEISRSDSQHKTEATDTFQLTQRSWISRILQIIK